jgi:hypothetical protein
VGDCALSFAAAAAFWMFLRAAVLGLDAILGGFCFVGGLVALEAYFSFVFCGYFDPFDS